MKVLKWSTFLLYLAKNAPRPCHGRSQDDLRSVLPYCESSNASANTERFLSDGNVVHFNPSTQTIPRDEVVSAVQAALNGGNNFEVVTNFNSTITLNDLTRNDMVLELTSADLAEDFTVSNAFVVDQPDVLYHVTCPAASEVCMVMGLVLLSLALLTRSCLLKEDDISNIPKDCLDQEYDLKFYVVKAPHFLLGASSSIDGCPNIAFSSTSGGKKHKIKFETEDMDGLPSYYFGNVALSDILEVEGDVAPIENFDLDTDNCIHYGQRIWRSLGFGESHELAQFVLNNVLDDPSFDNWAHIVEDPNFKKNVLDDPNNFENLLKIHKGGARDLVAETLGGTAEEVLKEWVYSQFIVN